MDFTAPYLQLGSTYLVPAGSKTRTIAEADQAGHRILVAQRSVQDIHLTNNLKRAELHRVPAVGAVASELLSSGKVQLVAGSRVTLVELAGKVSGSRVLDENFQLVEHALAVAKGRPAGSAYAKEYIGHAKASGSVQAAVDRSGLRGVNVAR